MPEAVVVAATRSPIGRARKGSLVDVRPDDLAAQVVAAALAQVPELDPTTLDDLYLGCADPRDEQGGNVARRVAVLLGHDGLPAATVNRFCASSVQTARMACHAIRSGEGHAFVSAGVECVSRYRDFAGAGLDPAHSQHPGFAAAQRRSASTAAGNTRWTDPRRDGELPDVYLAMGQTAENVATAWDVSRAAQDEFAVASQQRAQRAVAEGFFAAETTPVTLPDGTVVSTDDCPRAGVTRESVAGLAPVFREGGTVTAANCCPLNDGAAATVITSDVRARELGLTPRARILATGVSGLSPEVMGMGPVHATRQALDRAGMGIDDVDLVELNEAFAAQVVACARELGIDHDRLNVHGGAIALGHPFGATGARLMTTLLHGLSARDAEIGLVTLCVGGGQGMALLLQRL